MNTITGEKWWQETEEDAEESTKSGPSVIYPAKRKRHPGWEDDFEDTVIPAPPTESPSETQTTPEEQQTPTSNPLAE